MLLSSLVPLPLDCSRYCPALGLLKIGFDLRILDQLDQPQPELFPHAVSKNQVPVAFVESHYFTLNSQRLQWKLSKAAPFLLQDSDPTGLSALHPVGALKITG